MKLNRLAVTLIAASIAVPLEAQTWTAAQQEIIQFAEGCWSSWQTKNWSSYAAACPADPSLRYWSMHEGVPNHGHRSWRPFSEAIWPRIDPFHHELRPIAVQIHGDVALYYFFATYSNADANQVVHTFTQHELAVLQRRNGRWILIGGAFDVFPAGN